MCYKVIGLVSLVLLVGCAPQITAVDIIETQERPAFIDLIETEEIRDELMLCVALEHGVLWRADDKPDDLTQYLLEHTQVTIDNTLVSPYRSYSFLTFNPVMDDDNNCIGYSSDLTSCYDIDDFGFGVHPVELVTLTTQGETFTYSWQIEIR